MSRIGKQPIVIPDGVSIELTDNKVIVKGATTREEQFLVPEIKLELGAQECRVIRINDEKRAKQMHGLFRQLIANMVTGVSKGFARKLLLVGVGYRAELKDKSVLFSLGYSTSIEYMIPADVTVTVEAQDALTVNGINKQRVGQVAAEIRSLRPPEPYKGKGIRYSDEVVRRREGKSGVKK